MDPVLALVAPSRCPFCSDLLKHPTQGPLCEACWRAIPRHGARLCRCGAPLPPTTSKPCCRRCARGLGPFARGSSLGPFNGPLRCLVQDIEEKGRRRAVSRLAELLLEEESVQNVLEGPVVLLPVPLHPVALDKKGFNPSGLLVSAIGRRTGLVVATDALVRRKEPPEKRLAPCAWRESLNGAFTVRRKSRIAGRAIVLVDGTYTTGATVRACAQALGDAHAAEVRLLTAARAVPSIQGAARGPQGQTRMGGQA